jgi:addiction module HigA family antidote
MTGQDACQKTLTRQIGVNMKLTDDFVVQVAFAESKAGRKYADGHGFYLHVSPTGKYWRLAYRIANKPKTLALGVYPTVSLQQARFKANSARELLKGGVDPSEIKRANKQVKREAAQGVRPRHPGAVLRDVVVPGLAVSAESFADLLNVPFDEISLIINERAPMTCMVALKLERLISVKAESWLTMQQAVDLWDARTELTRIRDFGRSLRLADFAATSDTTPSYADAANTVLVAKAVTLSKAKSDLNGVSQVRG